MSNSVRIADSPYGGGVLAKLEEVTERLARINYKRGYSLSAEIRYDQVYVIFKAHVEDSRAKRYEPRPRAPYEYDFGIEPTRGQAVKMVDIQMALSLPYHVSESNEERLFFTWIRDSLYLLERHESLEWLRVDGELYEDPHA